MPVDPRIRAALDAPLRGPPSAETLLTFTEALAARLEGWRAVSERSVPRERGK